MTAKTPHTKIEIITPQIAKEYLETNLDRQRNVTKSHRFHLAQQMARGQWVMTGEPIMFDVDGRLVNGQHRLWAIIDSGVSLEFVVIRDIPRESFLSMDRGKVRSNANIFAIHGTKNHTTLASATFGVLNYRRALAVTKVINGKVVRGGSLNTYTRPSSSELIAEYDANAESYDHAANLASYMKKLCAPSVVATLSALAMIDACHNSWEVKLFWESIKTGAGLMNGDPELVLLNKLRSNDKRSAKLTTNTTLIMAVKCWNAYISNRRISTVRAEDGEPAPRVM